MLDWYCLSWVPFHNNRNSDGIILQVAGHLRQGEDDYANDDDEDDVAGK